MKRVEIMINQSITEDLIEGLQKQDLYHACTRWTPVYGLGNAGPREGSPVWPESNSVFLLFLEEEQLDALSPLIHDLKREFPEEGLKCFISQGPDEII
ncbi:MAG: hypothetical protein PQJ58_06675 [Spirochaetales bacterium]|nr:hypothetical protein [Spirochaetales bacterium]